MGMRNIVRFISSAHKNGRFGNEGHSNMVSLKIISISVFR